MFLICDVLEMRDWRRTHRILIKVRFRVVNGARSASNHKASKMNKRLCLHPDLEYERYVLFEAVA